MKRRIRFTCPMDCFDVCGMVATVEDGRVVKISGDRDHPLTRGTICVKGKKLLERQYHPSRLKTPMIRAAGKWRSISRNAVIDEIGERLSRIKTEYGSAAVMHYADSGYNGVIKTVDRLFFNCFGGVTVPGGSLCWGAGMAAQRYDFGEVKGHDPLDILNARTIVLWGRNPVETNMHMARLVVEARKRGTAVFLIDPIRTPSARLADVHIAPRPATDGALALGLARIIIQNNDVDPEFLHNRSLGFEAFRRAVQPYTPECVAALTGVDIKSLHKLAGTYARKKPGAIYIGYGMQRYQNGGGTVRCIDALGAITGNIGVSGGGVNYANKHVSGYIEGLLRPSEKEARNQRTFSIGKFADFVEASADPPIQCIVVTKANPLVQLPALADAVEAFRKIPFKVVIDTLMTDTARHADILLPCTTVLEETDVFVSPMFSGIVSYSDRAVTAPEGVMSEFDLFKSLAERMGLSNFPFLDRQDFLSAAIKPLTKRFGIDLNQIRSGYVKIPDSDVPWHTGTFDTPSGRYEFFSSAAEADGLSPLPGYTPPAAAGNRFGLRLITPHWKHSLHSQHFAFVEGLPTAYANRDTLRANGLADGDPATVGSEKGSIQVKVKQDDGVGDGIVKIYEGWWHRNGSVNWVTDNAVSDMGGQVAYYDSWCRLDPA